MESCLEILSVEDNQADRELLQQLCVALEPASNVTFLHDGGNVLAYLMARLAKLPDLILLDVNLPIKDGHEILEDIRRQAELAHLPVVFFTGSGREEDVILAARFPFCSVVFKPLTLEDYEKAVLRILRTEFPALSAASRAWRVGGPTPKPSGYA